MKGTRVVIQTQFMSVTHDVVQVRFPFADERQSTRMGVGKQTALNHALSQCVLLRSTPGGWVAKNKLCVSV